MLKCANTWCEDKSSCSEECKGYQMMLSTVIEKAQAILDKHGDMPAKAFGYRDEGPSRVGRASWDDENYWANFILPEQ